MAQTASYMYSSVIFSWEQARREGGQNAGFRPGLKIITAQEPKQSYFITDDMKYRGFTTITCAETERVKGNTEDSTKRTWAK